MSDLVEYEFANEAFYLAFEGKDYDAMAHLWSEERDVICLHPGWPALVGRAGVMQSWQDILGNPQQAQVSFYGARVCPITEESAAVVCYERTGDTTMVATNVFVREDDRLRMVSHHAGYCAQPPKEEEL